MRGRTGGDSENMTYRLLGLAAGLLVALPSDLFAQTVVLTPVKDASIYAEPNALANGAGIGFFSGRNNR